MKTIKEIEKLPDFRAYLSENCVICLEKINNKTQKKEETWPLAVAESKISGDAILDEHLIERFKGEESVFLACGHNFHYACIKAWTQKNSKCPVCRFIVRDSQEISKQAMHNMLMDIQYNNFGSYYTRTQIEDAFNGNWKSHESWYYKTGSSGSGSHSGGGFSGSGGCGGGW